MNRIKYSIIYSKDRFEEFHGFYDTLEELNESLAKIKNRTIKTPLDTISVYKIDVDKVELDYGAIIDDLDEYDVSYEGILIKTIRVLVSYRWDK